MSYEKSHSMESMSKSEKNSATAAKQTSTVLGCKYQRPLGTYIGNINHVSCKTTEITAPVGEQAAQRHWQETSGWT